MVVLGNTGHVSEVGGHNNKSLEQEMSNCRSCIVWLSPRILTDFESSNQSDPSVIITNSQLLSSPVHCTVTKCPASKSITTSVTISGQWSVLA